MASIVVRGSVRVRVFDGSGGLKNTRITEGMQRFILVRVIGALRPTADDPNTQEHLKSGGFQKSVREKERDLVGDRSVLILWMPHLRWSLPPCWRGGRQHVWWRSSQCPSLGCSALGVELKWNGEDSNDLS